MYYLEMVLADVEHGCAKVKLVEELGGEDLYNIPQFDYNHHHH